MKRPFTVGIIGLGMMGKFHVNTWATIPDVQIGGVCDPATALVESVSQSVGCPGYTSVSDMLSAGRFDAVSIAAPTSYHELIATQTLSAGIPTLVEKPIATDIAAADRLIALATEKSVPFMVGHIERFNPAVTALKQAIDAGQLGQIISISARRSGPMPTRMTDANVVIDLAVHDLDVACYLLGTMPDSCQIIRHNALISDRASAADLFITFPTATAYVHVDWITPVRRRTLVVTGTEASAELDYIAQTVTLDTSTIVRAAGENGQGIVTLTNPTTIGLDIVSGPPLTAELIHFKSVICDKIPPIASGWVGREALRLATSVG